MMRGRKAWKAVKVLVMVVVAAALFGEVVMQLWNWLVPSIFGLRRLNFTEALGLLVLSKLLLGGFHKHGGGGGWGRRREMKARWEQMTPEERERFRSGLRERGWGCEPRGKKTTKTAEATV